MGDHTNSSLRLMRWLRDYGELMRRIPPATQPVVFSCMNMTTAHIAQGAASRAFEIRWPNW